MRSVMSPRAVRKMTGTVDSARRVRNSSSPFMPGSMMSMTIRLQGTRRWISRNSAAFPAVQVEKPLRRR